MKYFFLIPIFAFFNSHSIKSQELQWVRFAETPEWKISEPRKLSSLGNNFYIIAPEVVVSSGDTGKTWENFYLPNPGTVSAFHIFDGKIFISTYPALSGGISKILYTSDYGANWSNALTEENFQSYKRLYAMKLDNRFFGHTGILYLSLEPNGMVYRSIDTGKTWTWANDGVYPYSIDKPYAYVEASDEGLFTVADSSIYRTEHGGNFPVLIHKDTTSFRKIIPCRGKLIIAGAGGIFRCEPDGSNFTRIMDLHEESGGFAGYRTVFTLGTDKLFSLDYQMGRFSFSEDIGDTWTDLPDVPHDSGVRIESIHVRDHQVFVLAGTKIFTIDLSAIATSVEKNFSPNKFFSISPNPTTSEIKFSFYLDVPQCVTYRVLDLLGKEIFSSDEMRISGEQNFLFDAGNFSSGVYYLQLQTSNGIQTRPFAVNH